MVSNSDMDQVWFVVSPQNPFKQSKNLAHEFDRLDMVEAAVHDNYDLKVSNIEFSMPKPSYTVDTLAYLSDKYPKHEFVLIIGEDNLASFPKWKNHEVILQHYGLLVYPRPNAKISDLVDHENVQFVKAPLLDVSATFIRESVKNNRSLKYIVPEAVEEIIKTRKLYL